MDLVTGGLPTDAFPWLVLHRGHPAWLQRAAVPGDFRPDLPPRWEYVADFEGRAADAGAGSPRCGGCGEVPANEDLVLVERQTGLAGFLEPFRRGLRPWPPPTSETTCAWCNVPGPTLPGFVRLCLGCSVALSRGRG